MDLPCDEVDLEHKVNGLGWWRAAVVVTCPVAAEVRQVQWVGQEAQRHVTWGRAAVAKTGTRKVQGGQEPSREADAPRESERLQGTVEAFQAPLHDAGRLVCVGKGGRGGSSCLVSSLAWFLPWSSMSLWLPCGLLSCLAEPITVTVTVTVVTCPVAAKCDRSRGWGRERRHMSPGAGHQSPQQKASAIAE